MKKVKKGDTKEKMGPVPIFSQEKTGCPSFFSGRVF